MVVVQFVVAVGRVAQADPVGHPDGGAAGAPLAAVSFLPLAAACRLPAFDGQPLAAFDRLLVAPAGLGAEPAVPPRGLRLLLVGLLERPASIGFVG